MVVDLRDVTPSPPLTAYRLAWCILRSVADHMSGAHVTCEVLRDIAERLLRGDSAGCLPGESDYEAPPSPPAPPDDFTPVA